MSDYGLKVIICAHQDVWSRFSGGSGAPAWTFAKAGLDIEAFKATGAAYVSALEGGNQNSSSKSKEPVGAFVWPSGYQKLAAATMATLFWAGDRFAWNLRVQTAGNGTQASEIGIQEYLQSSYIEAFGKLVDQVGHLDAILGFDLMNEPHRGYVGMKDWHRWCYETDLHIGHFPSALQSFALGSGYKQDVPFYVKSWPFPTRRSHYSTVDPMGKSAWLKDTGMGECVWRAHGAWQWDATKEQPVILSEEFFTRDQRPGSEKVRIEWYRDCYAPFLKRFAERIRRDHKHLFCFVEPIPNEFMPPWSEAERLANLNNDDMLALMKACYDQTYATKTFIVTPRPQKFVYAPHFYDLNVLFAKIHGAMSVDVQSLSRGAFILTALFFGQEGLRKNYRRQIARLIENGKTSLGSVPTIIGEVGIPFDINGKTALQNGDYAKHTELLDALIEAMEQAQVGFTLWNYNPDNRPDIGDGWNSEDFSVVSYVKAAWDTDNVLDIGESHEVQPDGDTHSQSSLYHGGRALAAILRPYAAKVAGYPLSSSWDRERGVFEFRYVNMPAEIRHRVINAAQANVDDYEEEARTTKIYLPHFYFDAVDIQIALSDGEYDLNMHEQTLSVKHAKLTPGFTHIVRVSIRESLASAELSPVQRAIVKRRQAVRDRHHRWLRLNASDYCAIVGLIVALIITLVLSQVAASTFVQASDGL
jgi:hypothetical protein